MKTISAFIIGLSLLGSGVANAAMSCCMMDAEQPYADMDMPCHETADNESQDAAGCDNCDCQHCVKVTPLPQNQAVTDIAVSGINPHATQHIISRQPEGVFQHPKHIS